MGKKSRRKGQRPPKPKTQIATAHVAAPPKKAALLKPSHIRKLDWAQAHIRRAAALIDAWRREGYRVFREPPGGVSFTLYAEMLKPLPEDLPLVVGDALHDLRDSLDHIIFAISQKNPTMVTPKDEESPQFPIHDVAVDINDRAIRFLSWQASAEVCDLAPDPTRQPNVHHALWLLDTLNNREKHREVVFRPLARPNTSSLRIGNAQIDSMQVFGDQPMELGAKPVALLTFRGSLLEAQMTHTANVIFDKGVEVADREVISTLQSFHDHIRDVVFQRLELFL